MGYLALKLAREEAIKIGEDIEIKFTTHHGEPIGVRVLIKAPRSFKIDRFHAPVLPPLKFKKTGDPDGF